MPAAGKSTWSTQRCGEETKSVRGSWRLFASVLNVLAGFPQSLSCFRSGVGIGFQEIDGPVEAHGFATGRASAGIGHRLGLHPGHIPLQAREVDLQGAADAEGCDAVG